MASSLETNKILAAVLTAGIFASGAGVISRILYSPTAPEEPAYVIEVAEGESSGGGEEAVEEESIATLLASADVASGESGVKQCASCHSFDDGGANKIGPNLYGVLGRDIGSVPDFTYSSELAGLDGQWDYEALNGFLADPKGWAPGTKMAYAGIRSAEDRADVILYLHSLASDPLPLPEPEVAEAEGGESAEEAEGAEDTAEASAGEAEEVAASADDAAEEAVDEAAQASGEMAEAASDVVDDAEETAETSADAAAETAEEAADMATGAVEETSEAAEDVAEEAVDTAGEQAEDAEAAVSDTADEAAAAASGAADDAAEVLDEAASAAEEGAEAAVDQASDAADAAEEVAGDAVATATEAAGDAADEAAGAAAAASGLVAMIADGDVSAGENVAKKCKACHVFEEGGSNRLGPALWDVVGRGIGAHEGYRYSSALSDMGGDWTYENLDQFLEAPKSWAPGTKMAFAGVKDEQDRADLIAYLRSLAAEPAPLQ